MLTRSASYPDRETAHWATQQVVNANEQAVHRWLAQGMEVGPPAPFSYGAWFQSVATTLSGV